MKRVVASSVLFACFVPSGPAWACATCLCGDPTITTMGTEKPFAGRKRIGIDYLSRGETAAEPGVSEFEVTEERTTLSFSYALNTEWMFAAALPFVTKTVERFDDSRQSGSGVGDLDLSARWFLGKDESFPIKYLWGLQFGLRLPTSQEQEDDNGETLDIDAQPGVGATVPSVGIWYGRYAMPWFFYGSVAYQHAITEGIQDYKSGDVALFTGMMQYALNFGLALQLSIDGRARDYDKYDGVKDENSGGVLVMATPGLAWTPIEDLVLNMSAQIPFIENANGRQEEDPTYKIGVAYDF
jgi:hypothetical protein